MDFHLKTYPDALRQLFASSSPEETTQAFEKGLTELQKGFSFAGYRKGKVPLDVISKANPPELMQIVSEILRNKALEYLSEQKIEVYGQPRFNPITGLSRDREFVFSIIYDIYPSIIKDVDPSSLKLSYEECVVDEKFVEDTLCRQMGLLDTVTTGTVQEFDLVKVDVLNADYKGDKKEAFFDVSKLELLKGKNCGDTISIKFDDLTGYLPEFLGKVSDPLEVKITELQRAKDWNKVTDAEIAEKTPFKTKDEYIAQTKNQFDGYAAQFNNRKKSEAISDAVSPLLEVELPKGLWLNNLRDLSLKTAENDILKESSAIKDIVSNADVSEKFSKLPKDAYEGLEFVVWLDSIAEKNGLKVESDELEFLYYRHAQNSRMSINEFKKQLTEDYKQSIIVEALREKAMTHLITTLNFETTGTIPLSKAVEESRG